MRGLNNLPCEARAVSSFEDRFARSVTETDATDAGVAVASYSLGGANNVRKSTGAAATAISSNRRNFISDAGECKEGDTCTEASGSSRGGESSLQRFSYLVGPSFRDVGDLGVLGETD